MGKNGTDATLKLLYKISRELATSLDLQPTLERILSLALVNVAAERGTLIALNSRLQPDFSPPDGKFYITLTSTNDLAALRNREKLAALPGRARRYEGIVDGEFDRSSLPTEEALELKPGAQVMLLTNDRFGRWVNGTIGRVDEIVRAAGADVAKPIRMPAPSAGPHGFAFSGEFTPVKMGVQWSFYKGTDTDASRYRFDNGTLVLKARGTTPADSSPLWFVTGDHAYRIQAQIEIDPGATAGLLTFYSSRLYAGLGFSDTSFVMHRYGTERVSAKPAGLGRTLHLRLTNDRHIVTIEYSPDGRAWERFGTRMEVSGYHHNVAYDFLSLRPAIYAAGSGEVRFRGFTYNALP